MAIHLFLSLSLCIYVYIYTYIYTIYIAIDSSLFFSPKNSSFPLWKRSAGGKEETLTFQHMNADGKWMHTIFCVACVSKLLP